MKKESELKAKLYDMIFLEPHENEHQLVDHVINRVLDEVVGSLMSCMPSDLPEAIEVIDKIREEL
jgi:hypothetical protein